MLLLTSPSLIFGGVCCLFVYVLTIDHAYYSLDSMVYISYNNESLRNLTKHELESNFLYFSY